MRSHGAHVLPVYGIAEELKATSSIQSNQQVTNILDTEFSD